MINYIMWPIYFAIVCVGYIYDYFACKKVPVPRRIVITGASSGIGEATAIEYAEKDIDLILVGRNKERLNETARACSEKGANATVLVCDITNKEEMERKLIEEDNKKPIDLILACAGVMIPECGKTEDYAVVTRELFSINIDGTMNTILPLLSRMQERKHGQIAIASSGAGLCSQPMNPIYSATKVALMAYGESLRFAMRDYNVFVSVISPGAVRTPMTVVPYLKSMESSLASVEGMAKAIKKGLMRDFMHIGYSTGQYFSAVTFLHDIPVAAKDYVFRAATPLLKKSNQYLIEFHPSQ